ncbi:hypothetical protein UlMin_016108 [Ulmus minor]
MEINLEKLAFNLDFHPLENLVSAALINGDLLLVSEVHAHTESCRAVRFIDDGRAIVMGSPDRLILATNVETDGTIARLEDAHGEAINKIIILHQSKIASGDDGGCIKVWDTRQRSCCGTCQAHEDYVSDMTFVPDAMKLLGTSVDGTLSVFQARSEFSEEELLSVVLVKTYCVLACFSVAGLITYLFVGWYCWINCKILFGRENYFDLEMRRKELQGLLGILIEIGSVYPTIYFEHDSKLFRSSEKFGFSSINWACVFSLFYNASKILTLTKNDSTTSILDLKTCINRFHSTSLIITLSMCYHEFSNG